MNNNRTLFQILSATTKFDVTKKMTTLEDEYERLNFSSATHELYVDCDGAAMQALQQ